MKNALLSPTIQTIHDNFIIELITYLADKPDELYNVI